MSDTASNDAGSRTSEQSDAAHKAEHQLTRTYDKNVSLASRRSKSDTKYWVQRLYKQISSRGTESPHWSIKIQHRGRRVAFALSTGNKEAAARRAMRIYQDVIDRGWDSVLAERRVAVVPDANNGTIGSWIEAASKIFDGAPITFAGYARSLRLIASEIVAMDKTSKRFEKSQAGEYRRKIDAFRLSVLTPQAVQSWRIAYVARKGSDPAKARAARISCNSTLRQAKSLFSKRIVKYIGLVLPEPLPFADLEFFPRESMRYHSKLDPAALMRAASRELAESDSGAFLALVLALGSGMRRGEIDRLLWKQINTSNGVIHVEITEASGLKSADSHGAVAIDSTLASVLQGYKARATGEYVIEAEKVMPTTSSFARQYRCQGVFDRLIQWLRDHGVEGQKPLHTLRKEAGSIIATKAGIFAASRFLRHADIQMTVMHYADLKERVTVDMGGLMHQRTFLSFHRKLSEPAAPKHFSPHRRRISR